MDDIGLRDSQGERAQQQRTNPSRRSRSPALGTTRHRRSPSRLPARGRSMDDIGLRDSQGETAQQLSLDSLKPPHLTRGTSVDNGRIPRRQRIAKGRSQSPLRTRVNNTKLNISSHGLPKDDEDDIQSVSTEMSSYTVGRTGGLMRTRTNSGKPATSLALRQILQKRALGSFRS